MVRYSSEFTWTTTRCDETVALRLSCVRWSWNHKMQNPHTHTLSVCVLCTHHVHFSFLFLFVVGGFFCIILFTVCVHQKWYEWIEGAPNIECVYSCIYKDAIDPYFSTRFFLSLVFTRFVGSFLPNNGITLNFQPFFSNSMFDLLFTLLLLQFLMLHPPSPHATRVCVS